MHCVCHTRSNPENVHVPFLMGLAMTGAVRLMSNGSDIVYPLSISSSAGISF